MGIEIRGTGHPLLTLEALDFLAMLEAEFGDARRQLLTERVRRQGMLDTGALPGFPTETRAIRESAWKIAPLPADLADRRVEITGPTDAKMVINALNSGARVFMADFEDANTPTWSNLLEGQANLIEAYRRTLRFDSGEKTYELGPDPATLMVRPRGWHLEEKHVLVDGRRMSASLFDFGLYMFWSAREAIKAGSGPYFYLPKLESRQEARLWNEVFVRAQEVLGFPIGTIKATVLIETVLAAFEMDEILFELRDHSAGLNAGRWDYLFSIIKKFRERPDFVLPDRGQITMTVPFMKAYTELQVATCHKRGAPAIGGMSAFIPNRRDPEVTAHALEKVRLDKRREAGQGCDGTWVAHPDLVEVARKEFDAVLGDRPNQIERLRDDVEVAASDLVDVSIEGAGITSAGLEANVSVGLRYLAAWLSGTGAAGIDNLMEDVATAEISRSQIWQWVRHGARTEDGEPITADRVRALVRAQTEALSGNPHALGAAKVFEEVALGPDFVEFLTLPAYEMID